MSTNARFIKCSQALIHFLLNEKLPLALIQTLLEAQVSKNDQAKQKH
jgi:hypothetical protein